MTSWLFPVIALGVGMATARAASRQEPAAFKGQLANFRQLTGEFKQTKYLKELDVRIETKGDFQIARNPAGPVVHWNVQAPAATAICIDQTGIVVQSGGDDRDPGKKKDLKFAEVGPSLGGQVGSLMKILAMDETQIAQDFRVEKRNDRFVLSPKNAADIFDTVSLRLNSRRLVDEVILHEKSGDEMRIIFSKLETPVPLPAKDQKCMR